MSPERDDARARDAQSAALGVGGLPANGTPSGVAGGRADGVPGASRRIVALVLPELFFLGARELGARELGARRRAQPGNLGGGARTAVPAPPAAPGKKSAARPPSAVVLLPPERTQLEPSDRLAAVDAGALRLGVRPGQTVTEACAFVAALQVLPAKTADLYALLLELAEVLRPFCSAVALSEPDALLLDTTGIAHLQGGEVELCRELGARARELGHVSQIAVASGPRIAEAVARFGRLDAHGMRIVAPGEDAAQMAALPLGALVSAEQAAWFARLGLVDIAQLLELPPSTLSARLGPRAPELLALARGQDDAPLTPCTFPRELELSLEWDEALVGLEPLLFVLRGVASRVSARLQGRGEAATFLELRLRHDKSISRFRSGEAETTLTFELSSPIHRDVEFERVLRTRLERTRLPAPTLGLFLRVSRLCAQTPVQLELGTRGASRRLQDLPVLLSELETDVGEGNVGLLALRDAHAPEARGELVPAGRFKERTRAGARRPPASEQTSPVDPLARATRLFEKPVPLSVPLRVGESFVLGQGYYSIEKLEFATRLDGVSWWTNSVQSRDYVWAWLSGAAGGLQALLFVDRRTRKAYVQGLAD